MSQQTEALRMAIEALAKHATDESDEGWQYIEALQACKEALEQPAQEPVEDYVIIDGLKYPAMVEVMAIHNEHGEQTEDNCDCINAFLPQGTKLYTHPAPSWQGLSDDEILEIYASDPAIASFDDPHLIKFARAIEKRVGRKEWVSITNEELDKINDEWLLEVVSKGVPPKHTVARAIEQALKEKNAIS